MAGEQDLLLFVSIAAKEHEPTVGHWKQSSIEARPSQKIGGTQISVETEGDNHHNIAWEQSKYVQVEHRIRI
jgi:hypothetical protein